MKTNMFRGSVLLALTQFLGLAIAILLLTASIGAAAMGGKYTIGDGTFHQTSTYWVDSHQDITIDFRLDANGKGHFHSRYSNGKRLDGDHFYARVLLLGANGKVLAEAIAGVGLNATYGGGTNVAYRDISFELKPEYRKAVAAVRFEAGHSDAVDDQKFWETAQKVAELVFGTYNSGVLVYGNKGGNDLPPLLFN